MRIKTSVLALVSFLLSAVVALATQGIGLQAQLGMPSAAVTNTAQPNDYLISRRQYILSYNNTNKESNWVSWNFTSSDRGGTDRTDAFAADPLLAGTGLNIIDENGYRNSGYDRGHMSPSADRTTSVEDNSATFFMTNMIPQTPDNNQGVWNNFEQYTRDQAALGNECFIVSGPGGFGGSVTTSAGAVAIPGFTWKIVVIVPLTPTGDLSSRINSSTRVIAIKVPNIAGVRSTPWQNFVTSAAQLQTDTGLTFFSAITDTNVRNSLLSKVDGQTTTGIPVIDTDPTPQQAAVGGSATFTVAASSTPTSTLSYQWLKESDPILNATNASLTLTNVGAADVANYSVTVSNTVGAVTSKSVALIVTGLPPQISNQPVGSTVSAGTNITLAVTATGSPTLTYQWRKTISGTPTPLTNGGSVSGATSPNLTITNAQAGDAGTYDVVVTNFTSATSSAVTVAVTPSAPTIVLAPANQVSVVGDPTNFSVTARGSSTLTYQWQKGGTPIADGPTGNGSTYVGTTTATLTITNTQLADLGSYSVVVSNTISPSATSAAATLTVNATATPSTIIWDFTTANPTSGLPSDITGGTLTVGNNNGTTTTIGNTSLSGTYSGASGGNNAGAAARVGALVKDGTPTTGSAYFQLTLTPATANKLISVSAITFGSRSTGTGPAAYSIFSSVDSYATAIATGTLVTTGTWTLYTPTLSTALTGTVGTPVTLKIYGHSGAGNASLNTANWRIDDLKVTVTTVAAAPTAPAVASSTPLNSATGVNGGAAISITFNQPVTLSTGWFALSSVHNGSLSATVTGGPTTYTITPPVNFTDNDVVTVALDASKILDTATLTLHPTSNTSFSFTTAAPIAPTISTAPTPKTADAGSTVTFTVAANGTLPFTYQWRKGGTNITGNTSANTASLVLTNVQAADQANYDVVISNGTSPDATSTPVALTVTPVAPTIVTAPVAATSAFGGNVTFTVAATGTTPMTYVWKKGNTTLSNGTGTNLATVSGATTASLTLTGVTTLDSGNYQVLITNSVNTTSSTPVALTVTLPPAGPSTTYAGGTYVQTFDTLPATGNATFTGTAPYSLAVPASGMTGWSLTSLSGTPTLFATTGNTTNGAAYSYGNAGSADRALGSQASGSVTPRFGLSFVNNTGVTLTQVTIGYTGEQWRNGGSNNVNKLTFAYSTDAATITAGIFTAVDSLSFSSVVSSITTTVLDGNAAANRQVIAPVTLSGLSWAPGQTLTLRWTDNDDSGADDGLAIDDFTFTALPVITTQPVAQSVTSGGTATFTVVTTANPATYQWRKNGVAITGNTSATTATLSLVGATSTATGTYDVVITNALGSTTSSPAGLTVGRVTIPITLGSLTATYDGTPKAVTATATGHTVSVSYSGSPTPPTDAGSYSVSAIVNETDYEGTAGGTLTIDKASQTVSFGSTGSAAIGVPFTVGATASSGLPVTLSVVSGNATVSGNSVTITDSGAVTLRATQAGNNNYNSATVDTTITAGKAAQTITFASLADQPSTAGPITLSATASSGLPVTFSLVSGPATLSGSTLTLTGTAGTVTVRAAQAGNGSFNTAANVDRSFVVTLSSAIPRITTQPGSQVAQVGGSATFTVVATGTPAPSYLWRKNGTNIGTATGATLTLTNVTAADAAGYDVVVTNSAGSVTSSLASLTVNTVATLPVITRQPGSSVVLVGRSTSFSVVANGAPTPTYQWTKGGTAIAGATGATFTIASAVAGDAGTYAVVVSNSAGSVTSSTAVLGIINRSYAGTYVGSLGNGGSFAMIIKDDNTGIFLGFLPGASTAFVSRGVTVDDNGRFSFSVTVLGGSGTSTGSETAGAVRAFASLDADIVFEGTISANGSLTTSSATTYALTATKSADTGSTASSAGFYQAGAAGSSAQTLAIVSPAGQAFVVTQNGTAVDAGTGTVDTSGKITVTTAGRSTVSANVSTDAAITATVTTSTGATTTFTGYSDSSAALAQQRIINLSTRTTAGIGEQVAIVGFVITGLESKPVLVRGVGPALRPLGVTTAMAAPRLDLRSSAGTLVATNSGWSTSANSADIANAAKRSGAFEFAAGSADAAIFVTLAPGAYTAVLSAADAKAGVGLIEVYDLSGGSTAQKLANLSTRASVGTGEGTLISGLVVGGTAPKRVLIRAAGPSLTQFGVTSALARPALALYKGDGTFLSQNAGWSLSTDTTAIAEAAARVGAFPFAAGSADSALIVNLTPGPYTVQVTGTSGATGTTLIEVYELP